ncbi:MAG TPA: hypothetical protein VJB59_11165 [Bdellovibrionota bacterium]|nr:hypothetical protein [Bdellovibrionota bacterium]
MLAKLFGRLRTIQRLELTNENSSIRFANNVELHCHKTSKISIGGVVRIGYALPGVGDFPSYNKSVIYLGENATFTVYGNLFIAPGCSIRVGDGASLQFDGENYIAHNLAVLCARQIRIGEGASISWGVTLIDDDRHEFRLANGKTYRRIYRPLIIGKNAGIQMGVTIPRGVNVGANSIISANTVLRNDVPENCLAYQKLGLELRDGICTKF